MIGDDPGESIGRIRPMKSSLNWAVRAGVLVLMLMGAGCADSNSKHPTKKNSNDKGMSQAKMKKRIVSPFGRPSSERRRQLTGRLMLTCCS